MSALNVNGREHTVDAAHGDLRLEEDTWNT